MKYWLMKNEVSDYSIADLKKDKFTDWSGVRNFQARNFMRDQMAHGDLAFFYHSNALPSGVAGVMRIKGEVKPDETQFDKKSKYFEARATKEKPVWMLREVEFVEELPRVVSIQEIRKISGCQKMIILRPGNRLSITPVEKKEWDAILKASKKAGTY
jgi:predicted RNA-binding protein with PUA-like domain